MVNGGILSIIAIYLLIVVYRGKTGDFVDLMSESGGFLKWFGALWLLTVMFRLAGGKVGELGREIVILGLIALFLDRGGNILDDVDKIFNSGVNDGR